MIRELNARDVKIGTATSVRKHEWEAAMIYPHQRNMSFRLTDEQKAQLLSFSSDWVDNWF